jgi:transmembrane sensor
VAVTHSARQSSDQTQPIELIAGEALHVTASGATTLIPKADLESATAWRQGKVIFHSEPLSDAIRRLNRYSKLQLEINDSELAALHVSGVFEAGDTQAFAQAVEAYLPVKADYSQRGLIRLLPQ